MDHYSIYYDHNRHVFLQYRDLGKTRHYVTISDGKIDCVQLGAKDYKGLKLYTKHTPEHMAQHYLKSHLDISRAARAILRGILGESGAENEGAGDPRFTSGVVDIQGICTEYGWNPSKARKFLRKTVDKPGGRWNFSPEEAEKVTAMLKEFFSRDNT